MNRKRGLIISFIILLVSISLLFGADNKGGVINSDLSIINSDSGLVRNLSIIDSSHSIVQDNSIIRNESVINGVSDGIGSYRFSYQDNSSSVYESAYSPVYSLVEAETYFGGYDRFLETVISIDPLARYNFVSYFSDWDSNNRDTNFWEYSANRAEFEKKLEHCYDEAIKRFGIGTAIVAVPWIISYVVPGGQVFHVAVLFIANATTKGALIGFASGAGISLVSSLLNSDTQEDIIYKTIDGASTGYLIGAVSGLVEGSLSAAWKFSDAVAIQKNVYTRKGVVYNTKGKVIGHTLLSDGTVIGYTDNNIVYSFSDDIVDELIKDSKSSRMFYITDGVLKNIDGTSLGQPFRTHGGAVLGYSREGKLFTLADESIVSNVEKSAHYYINGNNQVVNLFDDSVVGTIKRKNNIDFVFMDGYSRPVAAINEKMQFVTEKAMSQTGVKNVSLATLASDIPPNSSQYYRSLYVFDNPELRPIEGFQVHHSIEQQVLNRYPGVFSADEVLRNQTTFRGIPNSVAGDIHQSKLRKEWDAVYDRINETINNNLNMSDEEIADYIKKTIYEARDALDLKYGKYFMENSI